MNAPFRLPPASPERHRFTVDDVMRMQEAGIIADDDNFELIEGEIIDMPSEGEVHLDIKEALNRALIARLSTAYGLLPDGTLRLSAHNAPEPDFYIYPKPGKAFAMRGRDVLLVIEIAVTSLNHDLNRKAAIYRDHGVRECWVIDAEARATYIHRLDGAWPALPPTPFDQPLEARLIPGLSIRIADLVDLA
ncbi:MAG: Uma2 family endonuclease [Alphaproteobacteria bacterium]|nr:Uma2 family endonuclease [Alphaproteobacteria bacterium]